jgi:hypothetical protein
MDLPVQPSILFTPPTVNGGGNRRKMHKKEEDIPLPSSS